MPVNFRYRKLGYVALNVTDVARTTEFATVTFALEDTGKGPAGEQFLSCGAEHHDIVLYQNKEPGFVRGAWELETPEDVEKAYAHYEALGLKPREARAGREGRAGSRRLAGVPRPRAHGRTLLRVLLEDDVSCARCGRAGDGVQAHRPFRRERAERARGHRVRGRQHGCDAVRHPRQLPRHAAARLPEPESSFVRLPAGARRQEAVQPCRVHGRDRSTTSASSSIASRRTA